jgi:hypothetical protein
MPVANRKAGEIDHGPGGNVEDAARIVPVDRQFARTGADKLQVLADEQLPRKTRNCAGGGEGDDIPIIRIGERTPKGTVATIRQGRDDYRAALAKPRLKRCLKNRSREHRFPEQL